MIGHISQEFTVWCGKCCNWEQHGFARKALAEKQFRKNGWKKTIDFGWICSNCVTQKKNKTMKVGEETQ